MSLSLGAYKSRTARQYNNKVLRSLANATRDAHNKCACTRFDTPTGHEINMWRESSRLYRTFCAVSQNTTDGSHGNKTSFGVGGIPVMRQLVASGYQDTACSTTTHKRMKQTGFITRHALTTGIWCNVLSDKKPLIICVLSGLDGFFHRLTTLWFNHRLCK